MDAPQPPVRPDGSTRGLPPAVRPYVIPRIARQQGRALVLQVGLFLGASWAVVLVTHGALPSLVGILVVAFMLLASLISQDLYLAAIGADGVQLYRRGGENFFVAYTDLTGCELLPEGNLALALADGACLPVRHDAARDRHIPVAPMAQRQRILAARQRCLADRPDPPRPTALERGEQSLDGWINTLHTLSRPDLGAYRSNATPVAVLWQVAEDGRVDPASRVAAVVALAPSLDTEGRMRLQRLWTVTADPYVREALAAAQDARERVLREVLGAVSRWTVPAHREPTTIRVTSPVDPVEAPSAEPLATDATLPAHGRTDTRTRTRTRE